MTNFLVLAVICAILFLAGRYIYREKKKGTVCVGCPHAGQCAKARSGNCGCRNS